MSKNLVCLAIAVAAAVIVAGAAKTYRATDEQEARKGDGLVFGGYGLMLLSICMMPLC